MLLLVESESYYFNFPLCVIFLPFLRLTLYFWSVLLSIKFISIYSNLFRVQQKLKCSSAPKYQKIIEAGRVQYKWMNHWLLSLPTFAFAMKGSKSRRTNTMIRSQLIAWNTGTVILTMVPLARWLWEKWDSQFISNSAGNIFTQKLNWSSKSAIRHFYQISHLTVYN